MGQETPQAAPRAVATQSLLLMDSVPGNADSMLTFQEKLEIS